MNRPKWDISIEVFYFDLELLKELNNFNPLKGIDRPFGGGVESILVRSVFVNWRLGNFFYLILNGLHHKISKKLLYAA